MIFTSRVPLVMSRYTLTTFFCPMRCARSIACRSFIGFQSCSTKMTVSAPVSVSPRPPTCVVSSRQSMLGSALNVCTTACRLFASVPPSSRMYVTAGMCCLKRSRSMMSNICFIWQKISTRCCENALVPASSVSTSSDLVASPVAPGASPMPQSTRSCLWRGRVRVNFQHKR